MSSTMSAKHTKAWEFKWPESWQTPTHTDRLLVGGGNLSKISTHPSLPCLKTSDCLKTSNPASENFNNKNNGSVVIFERKTRATKKTNRKAWEFHWDTSSSGPTANQNALDGDVNQNSLAIQPISNDASVAEAPTQYAAIKEHIDPHIVADNNPSTYLTKLKTYYPSGRRHSEKSSAIVYHAEITQLHKEVDSLRKQIDFEILFRKRVEIENMRLKALYQNGLRDKEVIEKKLNEAIHSAKTSIFSRGLAQDQDGLAVCSVSADIDNPSAPDANFVFAKLTAKNPSTGEGGNNAVNQPREHHTYVYVPSKKSSTRRVEVVHVNGSNPSSQLQSHSYKRQGATGSETGDRSGSSQNPVVAGTLRLRFPQPSPFRTNPEKMLEAREANLAKKSIMA